MHQGVLIEWTDTNPSNNTFEGTARELFRLWLNTRNHQLGEIVFNPSARPGDADWRVAYIDVSLPEQDGVSGNVRWDDSAVSTGELGLRIGTDGWSGVRPYASMSIAREFGGGDDTLYDLGLDQVRVSDEGDRSFGRFAGGVEWTIGRVDLYGEFEARVGDMEGMGGRLGARFRF